MPADDALRFDQDKMPTPVAAAEGADRNPEQFVLGAETRSLPSRPGQYGELMAEQEILGHERIAVAHGGTDKAEEKTQVLEHRPNIMPLRACSRPGQLLHPHGPACGMAVSLGWWPYTPQNTAGTCIE